jgi:hypothetical protein
VNSYVVRRLILEGSENRDGKGLVLSEKFRFSLSDPVASSQDEVNLSTSCLGFRGVSLQLYCFVFKCLKWYSVVIHSLRVL